MQRSTLIKPIFGLDFGVHHKDKDYNAVVQELVNRGNLRTGHGRKRFNDDEELTYLPANVEELSYAYHSS